MTNEQIEKMTTDEQVAYWMGCLLISIGRGQFRSEICIMIDFYQRTAYQRGKDSK